MTSLSFDTLTYHTIEKAGPLSNNFIREQYRVLFFFGWIVVMILVVTFSAIYLSKNIATPQGS
jgi:hypothetical protein